MSKKNLLSEFTSRLSSELSIDDVYCRQLVHAAIGTVSPEVNSKRKTPIEIRGKSGSKQYNLFDTIKRAEKCLNTDIFQAMGVAETVITRLKEAGIGVNQVQLLLDPTIPKNIKKKAFEDLRKNLALNDEGVELTPETATLAIASKLIPAPDTSWNARFSLAASFTKGGKSELVSRVTENECYLWVLPPAGHPATSLATLDRYSGDNRIPSAEMGMGFSIIQAPWKREVSSRKPKAELNTYDHYVLFSPMWLWRANEQSWRLGNIFPSDIRDGAVWSQDKLIDLLPRGLTSLPRIRGCHICNTLFVDKTEGYTGIPTCCSC